MSQPWLCSLEDAGATHSSQDIDSVREHHSDELNSALGKDFEHRYPKELLDSFCVETIRHDHPAGALLTELITSFMKAYSNPKTNGDAVKTLDFLAYLNE